MGTLSKPELPPGPRRDLIDALHALHHRGGLPSLRDLAREVAVSRTTVAAVFSDPRPPRWGLVELLVEAMDGDVEEFRGLWLAATTPGDGVTPARGRAPTQPNDPLRPHQLPAGTVPFVGRESELRTLDRLLDAPAGGPATTLATVSGTAGVGKSALVLQWCHRPVVRERCPDGELYLDLRGHDAAYPVAPAEALAQLLRGVGVDDRNIPGTRVGRAALWRTMTSGRRFLVVLDNAGTADQVADLLPASSGCLALVTSRSSLVGLAVRFGGLRIELDLLSTGEAERLVSLLVGGSATEDPAAVRALAAECAALPIALRLAAERAASRPHQPLAHLVAELDHVADRLDLLDLAEEPGSALRTVFSWSTDQLGEQQRRVFALLGAFPGLDLDLDLATPVLALPRSEARTSLEWLARLHLVEERERGWGMHDLMRAYAAELLAWGEAHAAEDARSRLLAAMLDQAAAPPDPGRDAWLDGHRSQLVRISELGAEHASPDVCRLSAALAPFLDARGYYADALVIHRAARQVAESVGDPRCRAAATLELGLTRRRTGEYAKAAKLSEEALGGYRSIGDQAGQAAALVALGIVGWRSGHYRDARRHLLEAAGTYAEIGDAAGESGALRNLGIVARRLGDYPGASAHYRRALQLSRSVDDLVGVGRTLSNAGVVELRLGRLDDAWSMFGEALHLQMHHGDRAGEAVARINLAEVMGRQGRAAEALEELDRAQALCATTGYRAGSGDVWRVQGVVLARMGRLDEGVETLRQAVALGRELGEAEIRLGALVDLAEVLLDAERTDGVGPLVDEAIRAARASGNRYEEARALEATGRLAHAAGDDGAARSAWAAALEILDSLRLPDAARLRGRLDATPTAAP